MKLACADFTFPLLPHEKSLELIAALEMDGADIGLFEERSHLWPSREFAALERNAKSLRRMLDATGLQCADLFLQCAPDFETYAINHPDAARRDHAADWFRRSLDYAAIVGSTHVTGLPGVEFVGYEPAGDSFARAADELRWRVDAADSAGISFAIEAHIGSIVPNPEAALRLIDAVPGLTLTLDYTHFTLIGMPDEKIEPLCAHASHFHTRGARAGRLQAPFKENTIDYARVMQALREADYRGWVGIEYVWIDWEHCNECDNVSETILLRDYLRQQMDDHTT